MYSSLCFPFGQYISYAEYKQKEKMGNQKQCYRCGEKATSKEHVPPKCLFPELKDNPEKDFRINLIKVPSCDLHNSKKSKDDEFLLISLASSIQTNNSGYNHFKTKVKRALKRSNYNFLSKIIQDYKQLNIVNSHGENINVLKGKADLNRLTNCFESIIFGLFFHQFNKQFDGDIRMLNDFIIPDNKDQMNLIKLIKESFEKNKKETGVLGNNSEIFNYQFTSKDEFGMIGLKMTFYEGLNIFASLKPKDAEEPYDLTMALINAGIRTTIELPNGNIEFNEE